MTLEPIYCDNCGEEMTMDNMFNVLSKFGRFCCSDCEDEYFSKLGGYRDF